jgi:hypothetical protein
MPARRSNGNGESPRPGRACARWGAETVDVTIVVGALAADADEVLYKPADVGVLVDTVNKCVERARRQRDT